MDNERHNSTKQHDDPRIEGERPLDVALNSQGIQHSHGFFINPASGLDETSQNKSQAPQKLASESRLDSLASQQVDDLHKRLSVGSANLIARGQEPSVLSKQHGLSGNTPSDDSIDPGLLEGLSFKASGTGMAQNRGINNVEDDLEHLGTLLRRLNIRPGTIYHKVILTTCEEIRERAPHSTDVGETQRSSATSASATSSTSDNGTRPPTRSSRRLRPQREDSDSDSEQHGLKKRKTSRLSRGSESSPALSCLFYKVNPLVYSTCGDFKGTSISTLGAHLKKKHTGDFHCHECYKLFKTELKRSEHRPKCRPTRGPCVCEILPLSKNQGVDAMERWWETWDRLFSHLRKPRDPWWSEDIILEQINLAIRKRMYEAGAANGGTGLNVSMMAAILSDWEHTPADHLPDLQALESEMTRCLTGGGQSSPHQVPEASIRPVCTPGDFDSAESPVQTGNRTDGQNHDLIQAERESHISIPNSSDAEDPITQTKPSEPITSPPSYGVSQQDNFSNFDSDLDLNYDIDLDFDYNINFDFDFAPSQIFETEETQMLETQLTTDQTTDPLPSRQDPHVDAGETERINHNSDGRETTPVEEDAPWENFKPESGFFNCSGRTMTKTTKCQHKPWMIIVSIILFFTRSLHLNHLPQSTNLQPDPCIP